MNVGQLPQVVTSELAALRAEVHSVVATLRMVFFLLSALLVVQTVATVALAGAALSVKLGDVVDAKGGGQ